MAAWTSAAEKTFSRPTTSAPVWPNDPAAVQGSGEVRLEAFRQTRDQIGNYLAAFRKAL